ncbi:lipopolysaccharide biosynthesis protein [Planotetraspora thailandica]|uniref:Lipopolysaccharide biosynthesis protein n=1 Tax=Planotetraspora thailandica TaxID=487172 RepID=A0A8J3UWV9_9ACTN|nr:oligosaccharide flippase family protein [Planotetraspora thailandica]GII53529.1 lipopolysaccharide biosynthesis protein [Planotetraspora thailandica]
MTESPPTSTEPGDPSLKARAGRAVGWSVLSTISARFGTMAIGIVLARVLGPLEFGTYAVALVALLAMLSMNELGVSLAVVRWPDDPRKIIPTVTTMATVSSLVVCGLVMIAAPAFADAMGNPAATGPVRVLGLSVLINGVVSTSAALMQREFMQGRKAIVDQVDNWTGAVVSLSLALLGLGAMSLAVGRLCGSLAGGSLCVVFAPHRLRFGFDREVARRLLRFGIPLAGSSLVVFAAGYVDQILVGHLLGAVALGFYGIAFNLSGWPITVFSQPVRAVAPAAFARLQHDRPALNRAFLTTAGLLVGLTAPVCLLLSGSAPALIRFVYGPQWEPAAEVLVWLGVFASLRILSELMYDYLVVLERSRAVFGIQVLWLCAAAPAVYTGIQIGGLTGAPIALVAVSAAVVIPAYIVQVARTGVATVNLLGRFLPGVLTALAVFAASTLAVRMISVDLLALAAAGAVGVGAVALYGYRNRNVLRSVREA